jgi:hypothetical protein
MSRTIVCLNSILLVVLMASGVQAGTFVVGAAADTWTVKDDPNSHGSDEYIVLHGASIDRTGYVRFDLSSLNIKSIESATVTFYVDGSIPKPPYRNDSVVTARFAMYGLNDVAGNTVQDWGESVLTSSTTGAEMDWTTGTVVTADGLTTDLDDDVNGITEAVSPTTSPGNASLGATVTVTGDALVSFLMSRVDDGGLVTFILKDDDSADRGYGLCSKEYPDAAYHPKLELTGDIAAKPKIIYVTSIKDNDQDGVQDDISWKYWLEGEGYSVDFRPGYWSDPLDANEIAELETADVIIASRGMATGDFDGAETPKWNGLSKPIICTNAWMIRNNRWKWMNSGDARKDAGSPSMLVMVPDHPFFAGVQLDEEGNVAILDPNVASGNTSFLFDIVDAGNGTVLSISLGIYTTTWIAEWPAGVEYYAGAGEIAGGPRVLFMAGTQDDPYTGPNGLIMPVGVFNLNEAGQQVLRNMINYLLPKPPVAGLTHEYTFADGTAADSVGDADGTLIGGAAVVDGAMVTTAQDQWMEMPGDKIAINTYSEVTIAAWYTPTAGANTGWSMLAYFGDNVNDMGNDGFFMTSARGDNVSRAAISCGNSSAPYSVESGANGPEYDDGLLHQMVATIDATDIALYIDGALCAKTALSATNKISALSNKLAYLAKGGYGGDPEWIGQIQEFSIYNRAVTADEVKQLFDEGPK